MVFVDSGKKKISKEYPNVSERMTRVCLQCGHTYGEHTGEECPVRLKVRV